jgi:hypothetical protein
MLSDLMESFLSQSQGKLGNYCIIVNQIAFSESCVFALLRFCVFVFLHYSNLNDLHDLAMREAVLL